MGVCTPRPCSEYTHQRSLPPSGSCQARQKITQADTKRRLQVCSPAPIFDSSALMCARASHPDAKVCNSINRTTGEIHLAQQGGRTPCSG